MFKVRLICQYQYIAGYDHVIDYHVVRNECTIEAPNGQLSPCVNGYCVDGTNSYFCVCFDGFTGMNCDQEGSLFYF